jgi:carboxylate-amine ligase
VKPFVPNAAPTLGVEQEFHLVDPATGDMVGACDAVMGALEGRLREAACYELFDAVLEIRSPVCRTAAALEETVRADRRALATACAGAGARLAAAASHPFADWRRQRVIDSAHYRWVMEHHGDIAQRLLSFGLHVHVGVQTAACAIYVQNEFRRWLYPLLALSANSPFFEGRRTGLASTRAHLFRAMPRTGTAPVFADFAELEAFYDALRAAGDVTAPGELWWMVRVQPPLGTVEVRVFDLPTEPRRVAVLAALTQALVATYQDRFFAGVPQADLKPHYLEQNHWKAMRYGLDGDILDPETGAVLPMRQQIENLLTFARPKAEELDAAAYLDAARAILAGGTESTWQVERAAALGGDLKALELEIVERTVT